MVAAMESMQCATCGQMLIPWEGMSDEPRCGDCTRREDRMGERVGISAKVSKEMREALDEQAEYEERTVGVVVERAVRKYLEEEGRWPRT